MKVRLLYAVIISSVIMCGCDSDKREPIPELPPAETTRESDIEYTGTTVDFIHVETSGRGMPSTDIDMPEFPDFPSMDDSDNPFDEEFYAMFNETVSMPVFPDMTAETEDDAEDNLYESDSPVTTAVTEYFSEISVSRADMPEDEMIVTAIVRFDPPETQTDRVYATSGPYETGLSQQYEDRYQTADTAESYNIDEFMADAWDYPDFHEAEFDAAVY